MNKQDMAKHLKQKVSEVLELPGDVVLNLPKVTLIGGVKAFIENHRGIIEYTTSHVRIYTTAGELTVYGDKLKIRSIVPEEICIEGEIKGILLNKDGQEYACF